MLINGGFFININYWESAKESGRGRFATDASSIERVFYVPYRSVGIFNDYLLGFTQFGSTLFSRELPEPHPELVLFYAKETAIEPLGRATTNVTGAGLWDYAKVSCSYQPRDYAVLPNTATVSELQRYVSRKYAVSAEYQSLDGSMKFVSDGTVLDIRPGQIIGGLDLVYEWHDVPANPSNPFTVPSINSIQNCMGKVNSTLFDGRYAVGTVLFLGVDPHMTTPRLTSTVAGAGYNWEIAYRFRVIDNGPGPYGENAGLNYKYHIKNGIWDLYTTDGTTTGVRQYGFANFDTLFTLI